ncbi:MAG: ABC transporter permease [Planctomycetota bacterium]
MLRLFQIFGLNLVRDRVALLLTFALPVAFFSVFALAFGGSGGGGGSSSIRVIVVDEDQSELSGRLVQAIVENDTLRALEKATEEGVEPPPRGRQFTAEEAERLVKTGKAAAALILPEGLGETLGAVGDPDAVALKVIYDSANPISAPTIQGVMQQIGFTELPDVLMDRGLTQLEGGLGFFTPDQKQTIDGWRETLRQDAAADEPESEPADAGEAASTDDETADGLGAMAGGIVPVEATPVQREGGDRGWKSTSYYAAGAGVLFLLFTATAAAGVLLEQKEAGVVDRLLTCGVSARKLLTGGWLFNTGVGFVQVTLMFLWAWLVFGLELMEPRRLVPCLLISFVTAAACAAFGMALATVCRSRAQLSGISTVVVLTMSALGGSMIPKPFMPAVMQTVSKFTLNGWALDGYLDTFWYDDPAAGLSGVLTAVWPELLVLLGMAAVCLAVALLLARRWERTV